MNCAHWPSAEALTARRPIALAIVLLAGSFGGVAMRPEDIEALLHAHNQTKIEQVVRKEQDDENNELL